MKAKYIVLSNLTSVASDNILRICIQEPLLILKRFILLLHTFQHITAYLSAIKFTRLIPGNVCVQDECMMKQDYVYVHFSIDPESFERIL